MSGDLLRGPKGGDVGLDFTVFQRLGVTGLEKMQPASALPPLPPTATLQSDLWASHQAGVRKGPKVGALRQSSRSGRSSAKGASDVE